MIVTLEMAEYNSEIWMNALSDVSDKFNPFNAMMACLELTIVNAFWYGGERIETNLHGVFSVQLMQSSYCFKCFQFQCLF